jgi:peptide/nickel transport system permease protein
MIAALVTLFVVTFVVFAAMHLLPGSYADVVLPPDASPELRSALNAQFGLDRPLPEQYFAWLGSLLSGNFGVSRGNRSTVALLLARRIPVTLELTFLSVLVTGVVGLPLALLAGMARRPSAREASRFAGAAAMSTPAFVTGSLFLYVFSRYDLGLRVGEYVSFVDDPLQNLRGMALPALALSIFGIALVVRIGRDAVAGVLSEPYVTAALARGETVRHIVRHHVLRNASIPVVTVLAIYTGELMGGAVIVESLFRLPGLGQAALLAINGRDYPVVQILVLLAAAAFVAMNMLADFAYGVIDPRVRRAMKV